MIYEDSKNKTSGIKLSLDKSQLVQYSLFSGFAILITGNLLEYIQNVNWPIFIIGLVIVFAKTINCIDTFV